MSINLFRRRAAMHIEIVKKIVISHAKPCKQCFYQMVTMVTPTPRQGRLGKIKKEGGRGDIAIPSFILKFSDCRIVINSLLYPLRPPLHIKIPALFAHAPPPPHSLPARIRPAGSTPLPFLLLDQGWEDTYPHNNHWQYASELIRPRLFLCFLPVMSSDDLYKYLFCPRVRYLPHIDIY